MRGRTLIAVSVAVGITMTMTSACLSAGSDSSAGGSAPSGEVKGSTVTIWSSLDQPVLDGLKAGLAPMAQAAGVTVNWNRGRQHQPGDHDQDPGERHPRHRDDPAARRRRRTSSTRGKATALDDVVDMSALKSSMIPGTLDAGTVNGKLYGLLVSANAKSFVWYPKKAWEAAGYKAPETHRRAQRAHRQDQGDKTAMAPWCMGIESSAATGWPATDWFEDLVMRYGGTDQYNQWVTHKVKFDSPLVRQAAAEFDKLAFTAGNVLGGRKSIASTQLRHRRQPHVRRQARLHAVQAGLVHHDVLPEDGPGEPRQPGRRLLLPARQAGGEKPVLGGGDMAVLLHNTRGPGGHEDARRQEHR